MDDKYFGAEKTAEVCTIWPTSAAEQMGKIIDQCRLTDKILTTDGRIAGNAPLATRAGFVAEEVHAETFNLDAILKGKDVKAFTDRYPNSPLSSNNPTNDIVIVKDGEVVQGAQLKYYKDGKTTANAFRDTRDGIPHYKETDAMVGPSDQLQDIQDAARRTELKNQGTRPEVSEAARDVQAKATDRLQQDGVESQPLTKKGAEEIAKGNDEGKEAHRKIQNGYKDQSTIQQTLYAAGAAAAITTVIAGTINTVSCLDKVKKGQMTIQEATLYILKNTVIAAGDSALKAGTATAAVSLTARNIPEFFIRGSVLQSSLAAGAVAGAAVCAVDIAECLVLVAAGKMSWQEMETRTGKNIFQTGAGTIGASIGAALGAPAGPIGMLIGSLAGGMITSVAMTLAIENHIEKPFREIMNNTDALVQSENLLVNVTNYMEQAEKVFGDFKLNMFLSEVEVDNMLKRLAEQGDENLRMINAL